MFSFIIATKINVEEYSLPIFYYVYMYMLNIFSVVQLCCGAAPTTSCLNNGSAAGRWVMTFPVDRSTQYIILNNTCNVGESIVGFRYLWRESPCDLEMCPLYSADNSLPAPPFRYLAVKQADESIVSKMEKLGMKLIEGIKHAQRWLASVFGTKESQFAELLIK